MEINETKQFISLETISARLLFGATIIALILSNSPFQNYYESFFHSYFFHQFGTVPFKFNLLFWINEGLMTIFFLVVGLEIKYEIMEGTLNSVRKAALPGIGAIGGMIVPALVYVMLNHYDSIMLRGWAVPTATDIAFSIAVLSLLGSRIDASIKVFLTALAIFDDLAAIIVIALFYTEKLSMVFLIAAAFCIFLLFLMNRLHVTKLTPYLFVGFVLWACLLKSGVHATLAGVILAFMIPLKDRKSETASPLKKLQHSLHPFVGLLVVPLFAFANAGVSFLDLTPSSVHISIILGVFLGLFLGKQLGIFGITWLATRLGIATLPSEMRWIELYGVAIICGIGFTISLFIGSLAFGYNDPSYLSSVKIGVFLGSFFSGLVGYFLLRMMSFKK